MTGIARAGALHKGHALRRFARIGTEQLAAPGAVRRKALLQFDIGQTERMTGPALSQALQRIGLPAGGDDNGIAAKTGDGVRRVAGGRVNRADGQLVPGIAQGVGRQTAGQVNGKPGLAKCAGKQQLQTAGGRTELGKIAGHAGHSSPEARGRIDQMDAQAAFRCLHGGGETAHAAAQHKQGFLTGGGAGIGAGQGQGIAAHGAKA